jgi:hypothetical protein
LLLPLTVNKRAVGAFIIILVLFPMTFIAASPAC